MYTLYISSMLIFISFVIYLVGPSKSLELMTSDQTPNLGEENPNTVYKPGDPGANWTPEEIDSTRQQI